MSVSLDGRLPSGRRATLLRHIANCESCRLAWNEMRGAQDLALELPTAQVSSGFRSGLHRRIESGEGSPDAADRQAVPPITKLRYVLTGAAAAALFLLGVNLLSNPAGTDPVEPSLGESLTQAPSQRPKPDAAADLQQVELPRVGLQPTVSRSPSFTPQPFAQLTSLPATPWKPVSEVSLAMLGASQCARRAQQLRRGLRALDKRPLREDTWPLIQGPAIELRTAVGLMHWLERRHMVALPTRVRQELQRADHFFNAVFRAPSWEDRHTALRGLEQVQFECVQQQLDIRCCRPAADLMCDMQDLLYAVPDAGRLFRFATVEASSILHHPSTLDDRFRARGGQRQQYILLLQVSVGQR